MARSLPDSRLVLGHRRDGRPVRPIAGGSADADLSPAAGATPASQAGETATVTVDQEKLSALLAREKSQGERAGLRKLAEKLGFVSSDELTDYVTGKRSEEQAALGEVERREQVAAEKERAAAAREERAAARERAARRRVALAGLGATGEGLADAERLLDVTDEDGDEAVAEAAKALRARRPELFAADGGAVSAPGGSPAGGAPRRPGPAPSGRGGLEMARRRGYVAGD